MLKNKYTPIAILFFFNLIFFIKPLISGLYLSPADWLLRFPAFSEEFHVVQNSFLADSVTQFQPWYKFNKNEILQGKFPLWNNLNSGGVPHFANSQSSLLFPLNIFFYLLPLRWALVSFYFSKLFLIGIFTYLYLREIKIGNYESLIGATAFNFALFNITWMLWPHTNVIIFLPLEFILIEKYIKGKLNNSKFVTLLSLSFAASVFAGHPETLFHVSVISSLYFLFSIIKVKNKSQKITHFSLAVLFGIMLSGIQLVPFFEYLTNSYILYERGIREHGVILPISSVVYSIFPNITGNPSTNFYRPILGGSYPETTGAYLGTMILLLTSIGVIFLKKKRSAVLFFIILILFVLPFIYNLPLFNEMGILAAKYSANTRLLFAIAFAQAVVASFAIQKINKNVFPQKLYKYLIYLIPVFTFFTIAAIYYFLPELLIDIHYKKLENFLNYITFNILYTSITTIAGLYTVKRIAVGEQKDKWLILLSVIIFMQTGVLNINYNPAIPEEQFYPVKHEVEFLRNNEGKLLQLGGNHIIHPDVNMYHGVSIVENYDAMDIKEYKELMLTVMNRREKWNKQLIDTKQKYLDLFGVKYVGSYTDINNTLQVNQGNAEQYINSLMITSLRTKFTAMEDGLYAIRLLPANFNRVNECEYLITITRESTNFFSQDFSCSDLYDKIYHQFDFATQEDSQGEEYTLTIEFVSGEDDISFWTNEKGEPVLQTLYQIRSKPSLDLVYDGNFKIFENKNYRGDFYFLKDAVFIDDAEMLEYMQSDQFDPYDHVVLNKDLQRVLFIKHDKGESSIKLIKTSSTDYELRVNAQNDGYIVTAKPYYPGWKADVDGEKVEILKGNYAFATIPISQGEHTVRYYYDPISFKIGLGSSMLGVVILIFYYRRSRNELVNNVL